MTYDQYWYDDVWIIRAFFKKYQFEKQVRNEQAWLTGLYVYQAVGSLAPAFNPFRKDKIKDYPKEPYDFEGIRREKDDIKRKENEKIFAEAYMMSMYAAGQNWGKNKVDLKK